MSSIIKYAFEINAVSILHPGGHYYGIGFQVREKLYL